MRYNIPFTWWIMILNLYLCKQAGNFKIHQLRTLHIIDALLNLLRRELITKQLLRNTEHHKFLTDNQWAGQNRRSAIDVPMLKTFTLETFHLMRANTAFTDCDARACYNRMVAIVTGLALHKVGLPIKMSSFLIKALKQMRYHMNTACGVSTETNQHSKKSPVHGSGQGATDAPPG